MNNTFRLGRIMGVRVGVNWTVVVVFGLLAYGLATGRLPQAYKGLSGFVYAVAGVLTAVVFFISLLAHELAHAIVARRNGLVVEGITLWLLGGVARFGGEAQTPDAELRIAGSGPLVSVVLGLCFGAAAWMAPWHGLVIGCIGWLSAINLVLAAFNLIPAAPLDGGRVLRALWWRFSGDRVQAALRSAQIGQGFGWLLMIAGFALSFQRYGGLWLALVGWFLAGAAGIEKRQAIVRSRLAGVKVRRIMTPDPFTVPPSMTVTEFLNEMLPRHRHSVYPVQDSGNAVTVKRIREVPESSREVTTVGTLADSNVPRAAPEDDLASLLTDSHEPCVLVFDGDRLVGIVTPHDLRYEAEHLR